MWDSPGDTLLRSLIRNFPSEASSALSWASSSPCVQTPPQLQEQLSSWGSPRRTEGACGIRTGPQQDLTEVSQLFPSKHPAGWTGLESVNFQLRLKVLPVQSISFYLSHKLPTPWLLLKTNKFLHCNSSWCLLQEKPTDKTSPAHIPS